MSIQNLQTDVEIMLKHFRLAFRSVVLARNTSVQVLVEDFGLIVCCIDRLDYAQISTKVDDQFEGWRVVYITTKDNLLEKKYDVLWALIRCGYMKWLRQTFPNQIRNILNGPDNLGARIIEERLRIWNGKPKFRYLIDDNRIALQNGILRELSSDPSFFDYMPEEV